MAETEDTKDKTNENVNVSDKKPVDKGKDKRPPKDDGGDGDTRAGGRGRR